MIIVHTNLASYDKQKEMKIEKIENQYELEILHRNIQVMVLGEWVMSCK